MKVLLTGATGFIGKRLLNRFVENGDGITILARRVSNLNTLARILDRVHVQYVENDGITRLFKQERRFDLIVHAATDYARNSLNPFSPFWSNTEFPLRLLELATANNVPIFINLDTFFNSGTSGYSYLEGYALSKRHFQEWGAYISQRRVMGFANLRLFHVYGPGDGMQKFVPSIVRRCLAGENIDLTAGEQKRDFIHVDDVVDAIGLIAAAHLSPGYHHFDVGSGEMMRIKDFVKAINRLCGNKAQLNFGALDMRPGELQDSCADTSRLAELGWERRVDITAGLKSVIDALTGNE